MVVPTIPAARGVKLLFKLNDTTAETFAMRVYAATNQTWETRSNGLELECRKHAEKHYGEDDRKLEYTREIVESPSVDIFKTHLGA